VAGNFCERIKTDQVHKKKISCAFDQEKNRFHIRIASFYEYDIKDNISFT
jgi:hypothetical protein